MTPSPDHCAVPTAVVPASPPAWTTGEILALYALPFSDLIQRAQSVLRDHFDPYEVQLSSLLSIKTGGCPEDCGYCPQSVHHDTAVKAEKLMPLADVLKAARAARDQGATRFCMGAAWKRPKDRDLERVAEMIREVKALGLETCVTLGMLDGAQARSLKTAGLDYYNHNLDTAPTFYGRIVSTRTYQERLDTLAHVSDSGINVCCGGIVGMGESREQRAALIAQLTMLSPQPQSVPINRLVRVAGTPLADAADLDVLEFVRTIAVARIALPLARVRLSAGRTDLSPAEQALCLMAVANSIFYGDTLLTTPNPESNADVELLAQLGLRPDTLRASPESSAPPASPSTVSPHPASPHAVSRHAVSPSSATTDPSSLSSTAHALCR